MYLLYEGAAQMYGNKRVAGYELVGQDQMTRQSKGTTVMGLLRITQLG